MKPRNLLFACLALALLTGCAAQSPPVLRLATTTSTDDSGLLDEILPAFERAFDARVEVVAVGSGQALALGESGDADVLLVHSPAAEEVFVEQGYGLARIPVMYNDFVLVGPSADPAGVAGMTDVSQALAGLAAAGAPFISRGDDSGTHARETKLWQAAGIEPDPQGGWYFSIGQGMAETLLFAEERQAYTLSDRGTYLAQAANLPSLVILVGGDSIADNPDDSLLNPYSVIPVNPDLHSGIQAELAQSFAEWLTSLETQEQIASFGLEQFGQPLFYPDSEAWRAAHR